MTIAVFWKRRAFTSGYAIEKITEQGGSPRIELVEQIAQIITEGNQAMIAAGENPELTGGTVTRIRSAKSKSPSIRARR